MRLSKFLAFCLFSILTMSACSKDSSDSWMVGTYIMFSLDTHDGTDLASISEERILRDGFMNSFVKLESDHKIYEFDTDDDKELMGTWSATSSTFTIGGPNGQSSTLPYKKTNSNSFIIGNNIAATDWQWILFERM